MYSSNALSGKLSTSIREDRSMRSVDQSRRFYISAGSG